MIKEIGKQPSLKLKSAPCIAPSVVAERPAPISPPVGPPPGPGGPRKAQIGKYSINVI